MLPRRPARNRTIAVRVHHQRKRPVRIDERVGSRRGFYSRVLEMVLPGHREPVLARSDGDDHVRATLLNAAHAGDAAQRAPRFSNTIDRCSPQRYIGDRVGRHSDIQRKALWLELPR